MGASRHVRLEQEADATRSHELFYNEIVIDAPHWRQNLPEAVEAVFGDRDAHRNFLRTFGLSAQTHPFLEIDLTNWDEPFR